VPAEDPKAVIRRWVEAWNAQDLDAAEELLAPEFVRHDANLPDVVGPQAERQHIADDLAAFPDLHFEIEHLIAEGDLLAGGKLAEQWVVMDALGLLQQLGAVPGPG
jgi:predicted ester cyclase